MVRIIYKYNLYLIYVCCSLLLSCGSSGLKNSNNVIDGEISIAFSDSATLSLKRGLVNKLYGVPEKGFESLGNNFYKDSNQIYHQLIGPCQGLFYKFDSADYNTFEVVNSCFAKDENHVYDYKGDIIDSLADDVDIDNWCIGKDKEHLHVWG